jgi:hypothetical protein
MRILAGVNTWDEIKSRYHDEWIELVDFEWDDAEPYPVQGVVSAHHPDKKEFKKILSTKERVPEAALLYKSLEIDGLLGYDVIKQLHFELDGPKSNLIVFDE